MMMLSSYSIKLLTTLSLFGLLQGCAGNDTPQISSVPKTSFSRSASWVKTPYNAFKGWSVPSLVAGANAFSISCDKWKNDPSVVHKDGRFGTGQEWLAVCDKLPARMEMLPAFFQQNFEAYKITQNGISPLFTGYYAPELYGSLKRQGSYQTPLYAKPSADLKLPDRAGIETRPPVGLRPIAWVSDPIELFFLQIQGSGQLVLDDGRLMRLAYDGQNGHPYVAIGALLIQRGEITKEAMSMQAIKTWLRAHPREAPGLMRQNPSYVFFKLTAMTSAGEGPKGAANVPLTTTGSIAIDRSFYPFGVPVWIETTLPEKNGQQRPFSALFVTQDTGGAIKGAARADVFWGAGGQAEYYSGHMKQSGNFYILLPKSVAQRLNNLY